MQIFAENSSSLNSQVVIGGRISSIDVEFGLLMQMVVPVVEK